MVDDALQLIRLRNEFYRDNYRRLVGVLVFSIVIIFILAGALTYIVTHPPSPKYFATNAQGEIIQLVPLDKPNLTEPAVLQWANLAAVAAYTYNFVNYRQELQAASEFFTPEGWQGFLNALDETNNLKAVIAKKLVVSAVATGAPVVLQSGVLDGRYSWRIQIPLLVTYESAQTLSTQNLLVTMLVTRVSPLESARGIGIAQFVASGGGGV